MFDGEQIPERVHQRCTVIEPRIGRLSRSALGSVQSPACGTVGVRVPHHNPRTASVNTAGYLSTLPRRDAALFTPGHMHNQIDDLVRVSPLVVIPRDQLDKIIVQSDAGLGIENAGAGLADEVR